MCCTFSFNSYAKRVLTKAIVHHQSSCGFLGRSNFIISITQKKVIFNMMQLCQFQMLPYVAC